MSESKTETESTPLWSCGDPLKYPVPKDDDDLWDKLLRPLLERDKQQCDAWKDEVENLLIFAGLFSAVVTAFVVDSYKGLQPDPSQTVIDLLTQIATSVSSPNFTSTVAAVPSQYLISKASTPSPALERVNALWFISLVLSLTVVLVGTVALQWLREHQRYPVQSSPRDKFAIFNMRREGLQEWYVPQTFSALPMLLQVSLVLFLVGLIDFLVLIAPPRVFAPIITFVGLPILFIIWTTIIPSYQWILPPIIFFRLCKRIPPQCPYRSPQSSAFTIIFTPMLLLICRVFAFLAGRLRRNGLADTRSLIGFWSVKLSSFGYQDSLFADQIALYYRERCCEEQYKLKWLAEAPTNAQETLSTFKFLPFKWCNEAPPVYDWISGLKFANAESKHQPHVQDACYHGIHELTTIKQDIFKAHEGWCQYIHSVMWMTSHPRRKLPILFSNYYPNDALVQQVTEDEISIGISHIFHWDSRSPEAAVRIHELYIRLMNYYFTKPDNILRHDPHESTRHYLVNNWYATSYSEMGLPVPPDISEQYTNLLEQLLLRAAAESLEPGGHETDIIDTILPPLHIGRFVETACRSQDRASQLRTLQFIKSQLQHHFLSEFSTPTTDSAVTTTTTSSTFISPLRPTPPLALFGLMATYVGDIYTRSPYFDPHLPHHLTPGAAVTAAVADLVLPFGRCVARLGAGRVRREQSRDWEVYYGYSVFVGVCHERWRTRLSGAGGGVGPGSLSVLGIGSGAGAGNGNGNETGHTSDRSVTPLTPVSPITTRENTSGTALLLAMYYTRTNSSSGNEETEDETSASQKSMMEEGNIRNGYIRYH